MNDEVKTSCLYFIVHRSSFRVSFRVFSGRAGDLAESLSGRAVFGLAFDGRARAVYVARVGRRSFTAVLLLHCISLLFFLFRHDACPSDFVRDACV
jgi:hypothetical protein